MSPVYNAGGEALDARGTASKFVMPAHLENDAETVMVNSQPAACSSRERSCGK